MKFSKSDIIAILIGILFFVVSVVPTLTKRGFDFETDYVTIAFATSSSVVIMLLLIVFHNLLDLKQDFESKRDVPKDEEISELIDLFIDTYTHIRDSGDDLFKDRLDELIGEFETSVFDLNDGHIIFEDTERWQDFFLNVIGSLDHGDTFKATSLVFIPKWWDSDFGRKYFEENKNAIANKNVKNTRIFFLDTDMHDMGDYMGTMMKHKEAGVDVRVILNMNDLRPVQIEDFGIVGEKYTARSELYKKVVKRVHVYNTPIEIDRANRLFNDLYIQSTGLEEFIKEFEESNESSGTAQSSKTE